MAKTITYTEKMVGAGHPSLADTLNRLALHAHNDDGTHKYVYNVLEYGAAGDGSADDTAVILAAIASGESRIYCPASTYYLETISAPIEIPDGIEFYGDGRTETIFKVPTTYDDFVFKIQGGGTTDLSFRRGYIHDFGIDGQNGTGGACGILVDWAYVWTLARIYIYNMNHADSIGFHFKDCFNIYAESCQAKLGNSSTKYGTGFKASSINPNGQNVTQITYFDCLTQYNTTGILTDFDTGADGILIEQCAIGNNTTGVDFQAGTLYNVEISLNHIESNTTAIKGVATIRNLNIENNYFWNDATAIDLNGVTEVSISKNVFNGTAGSRTTLAATDCEKVIWNPQNNVVFSSAYSGMSLSGTVLTYSPKLVAELTLSSNASTPTLQPQRDYYVFEDTATTNVGNFSGQQAGQTITLRFNDAYTRVYESANIKLKEGGVYGLGSILTLYTPDGTTFYEVSRRIPREAVIPSDGGSIFSSFTHSIGDIRYDSTPTAGGTIGWACTTGGTPGTWKTFGAVTA